MTTAVIIADSGTEMARLTSAVLAVRGIALVRHFNGRVAVDRIVAEHSPTVIVLGEMAPRRLMLERLAEIRRASPASKVVVVATQSDARWLGVALRAGASAVVPGGPSSKALGTVLHEVLESAAGDELPLAQAA